MSDPPAPTTELVVLELVALVVAVELVVLVTPVDGMPPKPLTASAITLPPKPLTASTMTDPPTPVVALPLFVVLPGLLLSVSPHAGVTLATPAQAACSTTSGTIEVLLVVFRFIPLRPPPQHAVRRSSCRRALTSGAAHTGQGYSGAEKVPVAPPNSAGAGTR